MRGELGEAVRVAGCGKGLARGESRELMLAMAIARRPRKDRDDHMGAELAHHVDHVAQHLFNGPEFQRLVNALRVAEVEGAREVLVAAVEGARGEEFARADDAESFVQPRPDQVLSPFTAAERQVGGFDAHTARERREEACVLVVGVGGDHQHALHAVELAHAKGGADNSLILLGRRGWRGSRQQRSR